MKISTLNNYSQNFTSIKRTTYKSKTEGVFILPTYNREIGDCNLYDIDSDIKMIVSNSTDFFRNDINWKEIGEIFTKQFPRNKVNIYDFACSDGSEAYSLIISLIEQLGEKKASRFFPIIATDVDSEIINIANSGKISATDRDIFQIENMIKDGKIEKYFYITRYGYNKNILTPKEILTKNVQFRQKGIKEGLNEINKDENNIILARNFWKYLSRNELADSSWKLGQKVNDNTLLLIGRFDLAINSCYPFFLDALGFDCFDKDSINTHILKFKKEYLNPILTKDKSTWDEFVALKYRQYIPGYIY